MKLEKFGHERVGLVITGNPTNREPAIVTVDFPGGQVEITRAYEGQGADYWVHTKVNHPDDSMRYQGDGIDNGKLTDARIDIHGKGPVKETQLFDENLYHLAVRITRK